METSPSGFDSGIYRRLRRGIVHCRNQIDPDHHLVCDIQHEGSVHCDSLLLLFQRKTLGYVCAADLLFTLCDPALSQPGRHPLP